MTDLRVEPLSGERLQQVLPDLARLRIEVFRSFPYLYDGSEDYERSYLQTYARDPEAVVVACLAAEGRLVGAATALPLRGEPDAITRPLKEAGHDIDRIFYFGESVLEPGYRGRGVGVRFFQEREVAARQSGHYHAAVFCAVIRPEGHAARPAGYVPLDDFWKRRGFRRIEGLTCRFSWKDVGSEEETAKPMAYWIKKF